MPGPFEGKTTPWALILSGRGEGADPALRRECLETLCALYREPARVFIQAALLRRPAGEPDDDAEDLTQGFFVRFIETNMMDRAEAGQGSFRAYLKTALRNHFIDAWRKQKTHSPEGVLTRLGGASFPGEAADAARSPEAAMDRAWAKALLARAFDHFRQQCRDAGLPHYLDVFERHAWRPALFDHPSYRDTAATLGCSEKDVTNHLHRARKAFKRALREVVRQTVASDDEVDAEIEHLRAHLE